MGLDQTVKNQHQSTFVFVILVSFRLYLLMMMDAQLTVTGVKS